MKLLRQLNEQSKKGKGTCTYCKKDPTTTFIWADGRAAIYTCDDHKAKAKHDIEVKNKDKISSERKIIK